jgi:glucan 1,3-beta-glucosidase
LARRSVKKTALVGVNLGGWLLLERWMTPSLFAGTNAVDEYTFMQQPDARQKLREHQKNFIREEDFRWMRSNGVQAVRIPIGYWLFDGDAPFVPCIGRLDWAFRMAEKYDIEVLVSLHGAPGGQNGQDHSGRIGRTDWYKQKSYREQTVAVLERLAGRYRDHPKFWGLELLNEPKPGIIQWKLRNFYNDAYRRLIAIILPSTRIVFHDAFTPRMLSAAIFDAPPYDVVMDIHWYHFSFWLRRIAPLSLYYKLVAWHGRLITRLQRWQGVIVGEWNGIIAGEVLDRFPKEQHDHIVKEHIARQLEAYRYADAWFYWSYKTDDPGVWHFRSLVENGTLPLSDEHQKNT